MDNLKHEDNLLDEGFIQGENNENNSVENINTVFNIENELKDENILMEDYTDGLNFKNEALQTLIIKENEALHREKVLFSQKTYKEIKQNINTLFTNIFKENNKPVKKKKRKQRK